MRQFSSYGPINKKLNYYAPREKLIQTAYTRLIGEEPSEGGHFITVWGARQTGETWLMLQVMEKIEDIHHPGKNPAVPINVVKVDLDLPEHDHDLDSVIKSIADEIFIELGKKNPGIDSIKKFPELFTRDVLDTPLILIIDEFDALPKESISRVTRIFRNIFMRRKKEQKKPSHQRRYMLHGLALIGIRGVLGIENPKGSPFNIQQSLHIPNLTYHEVFTMFKWYEKDSGQTVEEAVIKKLYYETNGQPGLTCWFGELLTQGFEHHQNDTTKPVTLKHLEIALAAATEALPKRKIYNALGIEIYFENGAVLDYNRYDFLKGGYHEIDYYTWD